MGLILAPDRLHEMVAVMDAHGDGLIPTAPVLEFLREEAGLTSGPPAPAEGGAEQVLIYRTLHNVAYTRSSCLETVPPIELVWKPCRQHS